MTTSKEIEATAAKVVIGRTKEDLIFAVFPPVVLATTFMLMANDHLSASCDFVNSLAAHMRNEDIGESRIASPEIIDMVLASTLGRHGIEEPLSEGYVKKGTPEMFEGMYYAEFHPLELAAVGEVMREILAVLPPGLDAPVVKSTIDLWINASGRFVNDNERLALTGITGAA